MSIIKHVTLQKNVAHDFRYDTRMSVASVIQQAKRMRLITLSSVVSPALQNFYTLSHESHDFRGKKVIENIMCILIISASFD